MRAFLLTRSLSTYSKIGSTFSAGDEICQRNYPHAYVQQFNPLQESLQQEGTVYEMNNLQWAVFL